MRTQLTHVRAYCIRPLLLVAGISLATLLFSCTTDIEMPPPPPPQEPSSSSAGEPGNSSSSGGVPGSSSSGNVLSSSSGVGLPSSSGGSVSSSSESQALGTFDGTYFTDLRDGKKYKYETDPINGRIWMSENLNYSRGNTLGYCYGVDIDGANPHRDSTSCGSGYGRIYDYATAIDGNSPQGLCPNGWHIPSTAEWNSIAGNRKMPIDFYIFSGQYNLNPDYLPLGWKERDRNGFYLTSSGYGYFTGFWHGSGNDIYEVEIKTESPPNAASVRCVANDDWPGLED